MEINENNIRIVIEKAKKWEEEVYNNLELDEKPEMEEEKWEWEEKEEKESEKERNFEIEVEDIDSLKEFLGEIGCHVNKDQEKAVLIQIYSFLSVSASESFPDSKISLMECFIHGHVKHYCATVKPEMFSSLECEKEEIEDSSSSEDQMFFDICKEVLAREDDSDGAGEESSLSQKAESNTTTEMHLIDNIFGSSSPKWKTLGESATEKNILPTEEEEVAAPKSHERRDAEYMETSVISSPQRQNLKTWKLMNAGAA